MPACGLAKKIHPDTPTHETSAQVALCYNRYYATKAQVETAQAADAVAEQDAELAYERHLENAGTEEAQLQDEMERRQGVIPFDEALVASRAQEAQLTQGRVSGIEIATTLVDTRPAGPNRHDRRHPRIDWAAIRRIPVGKYDKGRYALRGTDGVVKFYLVSRSKSGWTSVEVMAGPQLHDLPKPAQTSILARIAVNPLASAELYAEEKEECSQCGTGLTHPDSLARKMGPDCAKEFRRKASGG
jgi:uncharacterized protein DUF6011